MSLSTPPETETAIRQQATIFHGAEQPLSEISNHFDIPGITRHLLMDNLMLKGKSFHIAMHQISADYNPDSPHPHTSPHTHDFDEINLLIPGSEPLLYEFCLDGDIRQAQAPASVYIPAGVEHDTRAIKGIGTFICIQLDSQQSPT